MDSTVTIRLRSVALALGVLVAVLVAYVLGSAAGGAEVSAAAAPAPAPAEATSDRRAIVMSGSGEATGVPDQLSFRLSADVTAADVATALDRSSAVMRRVQAALVREGVPRRDVQTSGLDIRADYDYSSGGPPVITSYVVSQDLGVLVRALGDSGSAITAAVEAGGNAVRLHGLELSIGDVDALVRKARDAAMAEASAKARQYAEATGQELGDVLTVKEVSADRPRPVPVYAQRSTLSADLAKVPIRAGRSELKVTVKVAWSFA